MCKHLYEASPGMVDPPQKPVGILQVFCALELAGSRLYTLLGGEAGRQRTKTTLVGRASDWLLKTLPTFARMHHPVFRSPFICNDMDKVALPAWISNRSVGGPHFPSTPGYLQCCGLACIKLFRHPALGSNLGTNDSVDE